MEPVEDHRGPLILLWIFMLAVCCPSGFCFLSLLLPNLSNHPKQQQNSNNKKYWSGSLRPIVNYLSLG